VCVCVCVCVLWHNSPNGPGRSQCPGFTITLRHATLGRTCLNEWSARRRDLYLTRHKTHNRQTSTTPAGIELSISASGRPQTHALGRAATGIGTNIYIYICVSFNTTYTVYNVLKPKTCTPGHGYEKNYVYELSCSTCRCSQIGQTGQFKAEISRTYKVYKTQQIT